MRSIFISDVGRNLYKVKNINYTVKPYRSKIAGVVDVGKTGIHAVLFAGTNPKTTI